MNRDELEKKLESLDAPQLSQVKPSWQLKLSVLSAKKSAWTALWLMLVPLTILGGAILQSTLHVSVPPWSWLQEYSGQLAIGWRVAIFVTVVMVLPIIAVILNVLSITWLQYDRKEKVLNISIRMKTVNIIIIIVAGLIALLFIGHSIADSIAGAD